MTYQSQFCNCNNCSWMAAGTVSQLSRLQWHYLIRLPLLLLLLFLPSVAITECADDKSKEKEIIMQPSEQ